MAERLLVQIPGQALGDMQNGKWPSWQIYGRSANALNAGSTFISGGQGFLKFPNISFPK